MNSNHNITHDDVGMSNRLNHRRHKERLPGRSKYVVNIVK